jgi:CPA2 family monovalent cation:H+ antiporter-2
MMLVTPLLAGGEGSVWRELGMLVLKSALVGGGVFFGARYGVPRLLHLVAQTKNQGLFVLTTIAVCFAVAALTAVAGLSLALGAFLAGLIVSESDYSHQATSTILPFRELFTSFFFVSIGMLLEVPFFLAHLHIIVPAVVVVFLVKSSLAGLATAALGYPRRTVLLSGLALFQIGEFAFILSRVGYRYDLLSGSLNQYFLSISILSMALTPFVLAKAHRLVDWLLRKTPSPAPEPVPVEAATAPVTEHAPTAEHAPGRLEHHLIIIGFGLNGRNVARAARYAGIPYVVLELNADTVAQERERGEPIMFGDPVQPHVLEEVAIERAQVVVIAISDPKATQRIVSNIRTLCGTVHVLVRSRFINEIEPLRRLGANEVIPEEFETSVEIFARTMQHFFVPADQIESMVHQVRADNYEMLRPQPVPPTSGSATALPAFNIQCVVIKADSGKVAGKTIAESQLRRRYGVTVLAIDRSGTLIHNVMPDERLQRDDKVYISGHQKAIDAFYKAVS